MEFLSVERALVKMGKSLYHRYSQGSTIYYYQIRIYEGEK